ncbi:hypothetical protein AK830_g6256 [Neonectria ditissima]|uniref:DUF7730 domain-containing protein n=1 Tax=Neonectria ditissima TaxID=78410 RepID=A0A0P7BHC7_9HYPO|nr:hypothetical protein AK830_g6256 [Neonectria ditissima]
MAANDYQWPTLSIRDEMTDFWEGWPEVIARSRTNGFVRSSPDLMLAVLVTIAAFLFLVLAKLFGIVSFVWSRLIPWGSYHRARRERSKRDASFRLMFLKPASKNVVRHPLTRPSSPVRSAVFKKDLFFGRLPAEIRQSIQLYAFGERTVHMDLQFERPLNLVEEKPYPSWDIHAKIYQTTTTPDAHPSNSEDVKWRWFSCVCHRFPPKGTQLSFGRRRNYPWGHFREPDVDMCLTGSGLCNEWPGEWPKKCQIGIMGWLLSCRNAYIEGTQILYSTNTIHIASPALLRSLQEVIPSQRIAELTSLELVWKPKLLPLGLAFTSYRQSEAELSQSRPPTFPALKYLRITFKRLVYGEIDEATGLVWPYESKAQLADKLHNHLLPTIDRLLDRIVPPSTNVIISCSKWDWYEMIDLTLIEKQGEEKTKPQRADIEGLKCWREIPREESGPSGTIAPGTAPDEAHIGGCEANGLRKGYWIHMPIDDVHLDQGSKLFLAHDSNESLG